MCSGLFTTLDRTPDEETDVNDLAVAPPPRRLPVPRPRSRWRRLAPALLDLFAAPSARFRDLSAADDTGMARGSRGRASPPLPMCLSKGSAVERRDPCALHCSPENGIFFVYAPSRASRRTTAAPTRSSSLCEESARRVTSFRHAMRTLRA